MKLFGIGKILLAFALFSGVYLQAAAPNYDQARVSCDVVGRINMCSGLNEGLDIRVLGTSFNSMTDSVGNFKVSYVQPGTYSLTIMKKEINFKAHTPYEAAGDQPQAIKESR